MRQFEMMEAPRHRDEARLLRVGREGVYLQAEDGLRVHLAGAERAACRAGGRRGVGTGRCAGVPGGSAAGGGGRRGA